MVVGALERDSAALISRLRREGVIRSAGVDSAEERRRSRLPSGSSELDRALGGGLPRGRIAEVVGSFSSGRTAFLFGVLAAATGRGEWAALVDPSESFDPDGAAAAGVVLEKVLWIRPRGEAETFRSVDLVLGAGGFGVAALDFGGDRPGRGPWPRLALRAERSGTVLLVSSVRREAGTFAAVAVGVTRERVRWLGGGASPRLLERLDPGLEILRSKVGGLPEGTRLGGRGRSRSAA